MHELVDANSGSLALDGNFNGVFGDPCPGVPKLFKLSYVLVQQPHDGEGMGSVAVQGSSPTTTQQQSWADFDHCEVIAPTGHVLCILTASYGGADVKTELTEIVNQQSGSSFAFNTETSRDNFHGVFGDPLPGIRKYFEVTYMFTVVDVVADGGGAMAPPPPATFDAATQLLHSLLKEHPVVLFIDSLDQLSDKDLSRSKVSNQTIHFSFLFYFSTTTCCVSTSPFSPYPHPNPFCTLPLTQQPHFVLLSRCCDVDNPHPHPHYYCYSV